jgi:hypothetical protein
MLPTGTLTRWLPEVDRGLKEYDMKLKSVIPVMAVVAFIVWFLFFWKVIPVDVPQIQLTAASYSFETKPVRTVNKTIMYLFSWKEAQQSIKNTDNLPGKFRLNFVFDNGIEEQSKTKSVQLLPNEEKIVTICVPLGGQVTVDVHVIPPNKFIPEKTTVRKNVSIWSAITHSY